jgi:hypothetical protein
MMVMFALIDVYLSLDGGSSFKLEVGDRESGDRNPSNPVSIPHRFAIPCVPDVLPTAGRWRPDTVAPATNLPTSGKSNQSAIDNLRDSLL